MGRATSVSVGRLVTQDHRGPKSPVEEVSLHLGVRSVGYSTPNREPCSMARLHSQKKFPTGRIWKTPAATDGSMPFGGPGDTGEGTDSSGDTCSGGRVYLHAGDPRVLTPGTVLLEKHGECALLYPLEVFRKDKVKGKTGIPVVFLPVWKCSTTVITRKETTLSSLLVLGHGTQASAWLQHPR